MAEAGIITFLHNNNYGSALQAYALQRVVVEYSVCLRLVYAGFEFVEVRMFGVGRYGIVFFPVPSI